MKVSVSWLQKYFKEPLPRTPELVDTLTFHSSEVEEVVEKGGDTVLDIKVLPDRAPYALSHRGIALELSAALNRSLLSDPLREELPLHDATGKILISIEDSQKCSRYMAALVTGVQVGPSPDWLRAALETVGQRSVNNVVDATNYVMLNIGQPLHAFDAGKIEQGADGTYAIEIRGAREGEKITTLTNEEYELPAGTLLITDQNANTALGIAGIKGGKRAEVTNDTTNVLIESANFDGTAVRRASQALKLWTDASLRFQNNISPELPAYGMRDVLALIAEIAGGTVTAVADTYTEPETLQTSVTLTKDQLNGLLGTDFSADNITSALTRLSLPIVANTQANGTFEVTVQPPFERRDITQWQDIAEEVGRILGYDRVAPAVLPPLSAAPDQTTWRGVEALKDVLVEQGFTEISTPSFASDGDVLLENPLQQEKPYLRASLESNMQDALSRAANVAPRVLGPDPLLKLFELGTVFTNEGEYFSLCLGYQQLSGKKSASVLSQALDALMTAYPSAGITSPRASEGPVVEVSLRDVDMQSVGAQAQPARYDLGPFQTFSLYPFALRDIAVWTPLGTEESEVALSIQKEAGPLLVRMDLFDRFEKEERISYAFRLVFQSNDKTLADTDIDPCMANVTNALNTKEGFEVR